MKKNRLIFLGKIMALIILIFGIIHDIATFTPIMRGGMECLSDGHMRVVIFNSLVCGTSLILSGAVILILLGKLERYLFVRLPVLITGLFLLGCGILALLSMPANPFAWGIFMSTLIMFGIILLLRRVCN